MMSNNISDITVNIGVEDVINPATFGGICLYYPNADDTPVLPYTEVSSYSEAKDVIGKCAGVLDDGTGSLTEQSIPLVMKVQILLVKVFLKE